MSGRDGDLHGTGPAPADEGADRRERSVFTWPMVRQAELSAAMQEAMTQLDGTHEARVALVTGLTAEQIQELGGVEKG